MSLHRRNAKRDATEEEIADTLRACGWSVLQISVKDGPDLFASRANWDRGMPRCVAIECKTGKRKLRAGQEAWKRTWQGEYVVLRSAEDALKFHRGETVAGTED